MITNKISGKTSKIGEVKPSGPKPSKIGEVKPDSAKKPIPLKKIDK